MTRAPLQRFVDELRTDPALSRQLPGPPSEWIPNFDPANGNETARFLLVLEAPGPRAKETGFVSFDNPDPTARTLKAQLDEAGISRRDLVLWNIVPWYLRGTPSKDEIELGISLLLRLLDELPNLECIVLVGSAARKAHLALSMRTRARILTCHHTSLRGQNQKGRAEENRAVFGMLK